MQQRQDECHPDPGNPDEMRDPNNCENEQEYVAKKQQHGRGDAAPNQDHEMPDGGLRFPRRLSYFFHQPYFSPGWIAAFSPLHGRLSTMKFSSMGIRNSPSARAYDF